MERFILWKYLLVWEGEWSLKDHPVGKYTSEVSLVVKHQDTHHQDTKYSPEFFLMLSHNTPTMPCSWGLKGLSLEHYQHNLSALYNTDNIVHQITKGLFFLRIVFFSLCLSNGKILLKWIAWIWRLFSTLIITSHLTLSRNSADKQRTMSQLPLVNDLRRQTERLWNTSCCVIAYML